ncbi:B12-binding domain-containing radical SAM protein [Nitrospina watsonii]|uniref:B12-binding domain-containing protein n=1 Tax=Nitrospina watsonii TaxID=1323948 RepID=A0ABN8VZU8_9BACT|nr:radical SAM protein [Nitrospina watsonii]CAI2718868.1 B12-binding domain-containing protein [Nitrospina watsonii]
MNKKVMLIFPPEWVPTAPYLALPSLAAVLRENGIPTVLKDINVEAFDHYFTQGYLEFVRERIQLRLTRLLEKEQREGLTDEESQLRDVFIQYTYVDIPHHAEKVDRAKEIVRGPEFYEVEKLEWALNSFREVMEFISISYYPASINFYPVESNLNVYRPWVSEDLFRAPHDRDVNIYIDLCERLLYPAIEEEQPDIIGISIGTPVQLMSGMTFCQLIRKKYPDIHITVGGNITTRLKNEIAKNPKFFDRAFHSLVAYEGEHALVELVRALEDGRPLSEVSNLIWKDETGQVQVNEKLYTERVNELPIPDFDGMPFDKYFVPDKILPYLGTRGCYWGKCTFCDHGAGYIDQYRAKHADRIIEELQQMKDKYQAKHILFTDESFPPALFRKLPPMMIEAELDLFWTTLIRFEESLLDPECWEMAAKSGCRSLYFGLESANERIIKLVKKDTKIDVAIKNLNEAKRVGIWSHVMGFFGFPSETQEEAEDTRRFLLENQDIIHSVEMYFFVLYKHAPVWDMMEETKIDVQRNPEHDLALDYYYTPENGLSIPEAMQRYEQFYRDDYDPWALRVNAREHVYLYITHYGTNDLPQLYVRNHPESQSQMAPEVIM